MVRVGICDDDKEFGLELENYLLQYAEKENIAIDTDLFVSSRELFQSIQNDGLLDILFLDIELDESTGIAIGKTIRSELKNETMQIVYVSSKEEYAMQLFDIRPMNFIVKPIEYSKVEYIMNEYKRLFKFHNTFFKYKIGKREYQINDRCILYFQSQGKKISMVTQDETREFYGKLSDICASLNACSFCEVHKSYVIYMEYVAEYQKDNITMLNGDIIPVSRAMRQHVSQKILGTGDEGMMV